jgi:hypothetical protein
MECLLFIFPVPWNQISNQPLNLRQDERIDLLKRYLITDQVHIPGAATPFDMTGKDYRMVYAVSKDISSNYLTVSQFGIFAKDGAQVGIRHGLSASMNLAEMNHPYHGEIRHFLKMYDYRSMEDLVRGYQTALPLIPDSSFVALPDRMGRQLFALVKKIGDWRDWISRWQTGI